MKYVLITPARNEAAFIGRTLEAVVAQSRLPERWVIVDDGSTDRTPEIVGEYASRHPWIELVRRPPRQERNFAGKVDAFNAGFERVQSLEFDVIGNLDADVTFGPDHFEFLLLQFAQDPRLGVAGTAYYQQDWDSTKDSFEGETSVHGACQLFRRPCFVEIGGYVPNPAGGIDWIAVTTARMKGWKTRNFPDKRFHHLRVMGTAERSSIGAMFDYGAKDYFLGGSPVWQIFRVAYRTAKRPIILGGGALLLGYCWAAVRRVQRPVPPELVQFHRREQMAKLKAILVSALKLKMEKYYLEIDRDRHR
jgi:glycosyltransferase involved in cell wall biosynthesis